MGIVNRRNAVLGWATWLMAKRAMKKKAKQALPGTVEGTRRPNKGAILTMLIAIGSALWFWRRSSDDGPQHGDL